MGLKQSIVIVNEFTTPLPGSGGSRGGTPGEYITRYMARELATESLAPIRRHRTDDFIMRYMARESATEAIDLPTRQALKAEMSQAQGSGGVSFGYGDVSLSHDQLMAASRDVQGLFEDGHTVMKTVISFDHDYLRQHRLVPDDFEVHGRGDYRGHLDQMKLRSAVMSGLDRMGRSQYDELRYVGVIQVDTEHVHCHLAMVDAGEGTLMADGTQRGKIDSKPKALLRRGIDAWLDDHQHVAHLSSAVGYERRNVTTFIKRWAHQQMLRESLPQFLLATLPQDRRLWRSSTNHEAMRKPNLIVHELVSEVLARPGSPMVVAMEQVNAYADHRRANEDLSTKEWRRLIDDGRNQIVERGVNGIYSMLRQLPEDALTVRTAMLDVMGMDYEQLAARARESEDDDPDLVGFGFRLRSYSSRLNDHDDKREEYRIKVRQWEATDADGLAPLPSYALYDFYLEEEEYHARCAAKYRHFLSFTPPSTTWYDEWDPVAEYGEKMMSLESMRRDDSLRKTKDPDTAERVGLEIYGQRGGHLVSLGDEASLASLDTRISKMREEYGRRLSDYEMRLASQGLVLIVVRDEDTDIDVPSIEPGAEFPFQEVKGLDLHHMRYDFSRDVAVGTQATASFKEWARRRSESLQRAVEYLEFSGQSLSVEDLPIGDVQAMVALANDLEPEFDGLAVLPSQVAKLTLEKELLRRSATVRLDQSLHHEMVSSVDRAVLEPAPDGLGFEPDGVTDVQQS